MASWDLSREVISDDRSDNGITARADLAGMYVCVCVRVYAMGKRTVDVNLFVPAFGTE